MGCSSVSRSVLVVSPERGRRLELGDVVAAGGWQRATVAAAQEAGWELSPVLPHLVVIDVPDSGDSGWALDLIDRIRRVEGGDRARGGADATR